MASVATQRLKLREVGPAESAQGVIATEGGELFGREHSELLGEEGIRAALMGKIAHLAMAGERQHRLATEFLHPLAQHVLVYVQIARGLRHRPPALLDQLHRLNLALAAELSSRCHPTPPVSCSTLTRCLRNR